MTADLIRIESEMLRATLHPVGGELWSLCDAEGHALMTDADPAYWAGHAPLLFPIVGRLNDDRLSLDGRAFAMKQHGFARQMAWEVVGTSESAATFRLRDTGDTRAAYPFAFELAVLYMIEDATLSCIVRVTNSGDAPLPFSIGFHPAFAWPLPYGARREAHRVTFGRAESATIARLSDGLIAGERPTPLTGRVLALSDDLFADDALIWAPVASQSVTYGPKDGPRLRIEFPDTPALGIWTKPGARFLCIEPWHGHADPAGFAGDFRDKPGVMTLAPDAERRFAMHVTLVR